MYYLKSDVDIAQFLLTTAKCAGDVYFCTKNGDQLDLKSELMRFVFASQMRNEGFLYESTIRLADENDLKIIAAYVNA